MPPKVPTMPPQPIVAPAAEMATETPFPKTDGESSSKKNKTKKRKNQRKKLKKASQQQQQEVQKQAGLGAPSAFGTANTTVVAAGVKKGGLGGGGGPGSEGDEEQSSGSSDSFTTSTEGSSPPGGATAAAAAARIGRDPLRLGSPEDIALLASVGLGPNQKQQEVRTHVCVLGAWRGFLNLRLVVVSSAGMV